MMQRHPKRRLFMSWLGAGLVLVASSIVASDRARSEANRSEIETIIREHLERDPALVESIIRDYLRAHPEVVQSALSELIRRHMPPGQTATPAIDHAAVIKAHAATLFNSPRQVVLGNSQGDVTLVEFFDYNCGFCKRAHNDKLELLRTDGQLKVVLKELPVLGPGSLEAAQVAVAVRMQDPTGEKYLVFHRTLMAARGPANKMAALAAAREAGFDIERIERDLSNPDVKTSIDEARMLASALGITGTPSFVIGDSVVVGAVGLAKLTEKIAAARR